MMRPSFKSVGAHAVLVEFDTKVSNVGNQAVIALDQALNTANINGLKEVVPAYVSLLVEFDPLITDHIAIEDAIQSLLPISTSKEGKHRHHTVLICYDDDLAPDLIAVAESSDMSVEAVIKAHLSGDYKICMYGFAPGYAYMAGVPKEIQMPRKSAAVRDIPAGSVLIAGPQCLITTLTMPTGWSIIGRSPTEVLLTDPEQPFLFDVSDHVSFKRIDRETYEQKKKI